MPGGRPTKLNKEVIRKAQEYLDGCEGVAAHTLLPTVEGLAMSLDIWRDTLYDWAAKGDTPDGTDLQRKFSNIFHRLQQAQANKLIQNGLAGRYNPTITAIMMSKHGYVRQEQVDQKVSGNVQFINDVPRPRSDSPSQSS